MDVDTTQQLNGNQHDANDCDPANSEVDVTIDQKKYPRLAGYLEPDNSKGNRDGGEGGGTLSEVLSLIRNLNIYTNQEDYYNACNLAELLLETSDQENTLPVELIAACLLHDYILELKSNGSEDKVNFNELLKSNLDMNAVIAIILGMDNINKEETELRQNATSTEDHTWDYRAGIVNLNELAQIVEDNSIISIFLQSLSLINNIENMNSEDLYHDAQALISVYAPALEIAGYPELATRAYGIALYYLNAKGEMENVTDEHIKKQIDEYREIKTWADENKIFGVFSNALFSVKKNLEEVFGIECTLGYRPEMMKTLGSSLEKQNRYREKGKGEQLPDMFGLKIVIDLNEDEYGNNKMQKMIEYAYITFYDELMSTLPDGATLLMGNVDKDEPHIEVTMGNMTTETKKINHKDNEIIMEVSGERKSRYSAAH